MKYFVVYTALRIVMFIAVYGVLFAIATALDAGENAWIWILVGSAVISSALSLKFLAGPREALAQNVQQRAERAAAKFEEMKTKEDVD